MGAVDGASWSSPIGMPGLMKYMSAVTGVHQAFHAGFRCGALVALEFTLLQVEIAGLAHFGLNEDKGSIRVGGADGVDKSLEAFVDLLGRRVGESVEYECVGLGVGGYVGKESVEFALAAEAEVAEFHACGPLHAGRISHAWARCRCAVGDA